MENLLERAYSRDSAVLIELSQGAVTEALSEGNIKSFLFNELQDLDPNSGWVLKDEDLIQFALNTVYQPNEKNPEHTFMFAVWANDVDWEEYHPTSDVEDEDGNIRYDIEL